MIDKKRMRDIVDALVSAVSVPEPLEKTASAPLSKINRQLKGHPLNKLDEFVPDCDDLFIVDEHFSLPRGTTYKVVVCHGDPTLLNEQLFDRGVILGDWGQLPKDQLPKWQALMQELGVGTQYWKGPELLEPPIVPNDESPFSDNNVT